MNIAQQRASDRRQCSYGPYSETPQQKKSADRRERYSKAWSVGCMVPVCLHTVALGSARGRWR